MKVKFSQDEFEEFVRKYYEKFENLSDINIKRYTRYEETIINCYGKELKNITLGAVSVTGTIDFLGKSKTVQELVEVNKAKKILGSFVNDSNYNITDINFDFSINDKKETVLDGITLDVHYKENTLEVKESKTNEKVKFKEPPNGWMVK